MHNIWESFAFPPTIALCSFDLQEFVGDQLCRKTVVIHSVPDSLRARSQILLGLGSRLIEVASNTRNSESPENTLSSFIQFILLGFAATVWWVSFVLNFVLFCFFFFLRQSLTMYPRMASEPEICLPLPP